MLNRSRSQYILNSKIGVWVQHLQRSRRLPGRSSAQLAYPSAHHTVSFPGTRTPLAPNLSMYGEDKITQPACLAEYRREAVQQVRAESNQPVETGRLSKTKPTDCGTMPQLRDKKKLDYIVPCPPPSSSSQQHPLHTAVPPCIKWNTPRIERVMPLPIERACVTSAGQLDRHVVASPRPCSSSEQVAGMRR